MAVTHVSSASELKAALASAKGGDTILVKSGSYGWVTLDNFKFNDYVTIKSADGNGGALFKHIGLNNTSHLRLDSLTVEFGATMPELHHLKAIEVRKTDHLQVVNSEIIGHAATKDWKDVPRGIQVWDGSSNIELIDNHFHHFGRAVVIGGANNVSIKNNLVDYIHSDGIFVQNSNNIVIEDNLLTDFFRTGTVHADYIQFDAGKWTPSHDVIIRGNVMLQGNGNGDVQGIFGDAGDYYEIHKGAFKNFLVENNIYFDTGINGFHFWSGENMLLRNNTVLMDPSTSHPNSPSRIFMRGPQTNSVVKDNVTLQVAAEGGATASGNVIVQFRDPSKPNYYGNLFSNPFADPASLADLAPKSGTPISFGSGKGAEKLFQELLGGADPMPANTAPVAGDDTASTIQGSPVTIDVLANDADDDGDALTVASVSQAANGTVTRNADNTVSYAPAAGFTGTDRFTYTVSDGNGGSDTASVTVTVAAAAGAIPAPVLASDAQSFNGTKGAALILPHQQAYEVASGTLELAFTADAISGRRGLFSKDALSFGTGGHFTIQIEDGAFVVRLQSKTQSFTVTAANAVTAGQQHHAAITFGPEGLKLYLDGVLTATNAYTGGLTGNAEPVVIGASQATSGQKVADVLTDFFAGTIAKVALYNQALPAANIAELNEEGVSNTAPVAGDDAASALQGSPVTIDVLANDADDDGDALTVTSVGQAANGTVTRNADNTVSYAPAAGFAGADSFTYTISDGNGGSDTASVTVTVAAAADAITYVSSVLELQAALASANDGDTILVKSGSYGRVILDSLKFNNQVTIKSADGNGGAHFQQITIKNSTHIALDSLTVEYGRVTDERNEIAIDIRNSHHVKIVDSEIIGHAETKDWSDVGRGIMSWEGSSHIEVIGNHLHHFGRAAFFFGNNMVIKNNVIENIRIDGLFFGKSKNLLIENNLLTDFYRQGTDHADYIQFDPGTSGPAGDVVIRGNVMLKGNGNGDVQGIFGANHHMDVHNEGTYENFLIEDNIYLDHGLNAVYFYSGNNMVVRNNTILTDPADGRVVWMRLLGPQTNSVLEDNVATRVIAEGGATASGNVIVQYKDASHPNYYGDLFVDPFATPASVADLAPKAGTPVGYGSGKGAEARFQELLGGADPTPANTAPVAGDDSASTVQGSPVTIDVLANDADDDGDALTVASVGQAANGTVTRNADNTVSYAPAAGFTGTDRFTYTVADGNGGSDTASVAVNVGSASAVVAAINAGGSAFMAADGTAYSADKYVSGGKAFSTEAAIAGTTDDALYQSERYGNFSYAVAVADGTYNVTLQFAEIYWNAAGQRVFDVKAEGKLILDDLDIFSAAGGKNKAYDVTVPVTVNDGILNLDFITVRNNAKISAIQIANVLGDSFDAIATVALSDTLADLADPLLA